jgi:acetyl-CoA carboxylase carboxyl transferase subunit alpha
MLQYSIYSVISPEGCASILWKSASHAAEAAEVLGITAPRLKSLGLTDDVIEEPVGGAHRHPEIMFETLKSALAEQLKKFSAMSATKRLALRQEKIMSFGKYKVSTPKETAVEEKTETPSN